MGSEIPLSDFDRSNKGGCRGRDSSYLWVCWLWSSGIECSAWPCALGRHDPTKVSVSELCGRLKGQTAMKLFHQFRQLKKKPYWGNHFWAKGYCVDTVGLDADMIRKYVRYQEEKEKQLEQLQLLWANLIAAQRMLPCLLRGQGLAPLWGAHQSRALRVRMFTLLSPDCVPTL